MEVTNLMTQDNHKPVSRANECVQALRLPTIEPSLLLGERDRVRASSLPRFAAAVLPVFLLGLGLLMSGCRTAKVTSEAQLGKAEPETPSVVYVADFGLVPGEIEDDRGILSDVPVISRPAREFLYGQEPPTERARELVELMSTSLVKDIEAKGFTAARYSPEDPLPTTGWLVRGMYTKIEEGNKLRRTLIGFGAGETEVQVVTVFDDLAQGPPKPLYEVDTKASSGHAPGSAPLLVLGPYPAAVRFMLSGTDIDRNVRQTARQIADELVRQVDEAP